MNGHHATNPPEPTRPAPPVVTAVVVNFNSWPDVEALVAALSRSPVVASGAFEIVIVDNASDGSAPESLRPPPPGVRLITRRENGGFAVGVNAGWRASRGRWVLLLNPDVELPDGWPGRIVSRALVLETAEGGPPGVVGFGLRNPDGSPQPSVGAFPGFFRAVREQFIPRSRRKYQAVWRTKPGPVDWVTGACALVNGRAMEAVGGLDEDFFLYYEEVALCRSVRRLGWRVEYDPGPDVAVVHLRPLQNRPVSPRMRVITRHSKLLYFRKHLPRWQFLSLCGVVSAEAKFRSTWARFRGLSEEQRAWETVARIVRELRSGADLGGVAVRDLADSIVGAHPRERDRQPAGGIENVRPRV